MIKVSTNTSDSPTAANLYFPDLFLSCMQPSDTTAFAFVRSEFTSRTLPPGVKGVKVSFHYICGKSSNVLLLCESKYDPMSLQPSGGSTASDCNLAVDIINRSPTSYSRYLLHNTERQTPSLSIFRSTIWTTPDSFKVTGSAIKSPNWNHATVELPASRTESQVIVRADVKPAVGAVGMDNIVYHADTKCIPT